MSCRHAVLVQALLCLYTCLKSEPKSRYSLGRSPCVHVLAWVQCIKRPMLKHINEPRSIGTHLNEYCHTPNNLGNFIIFRGAHVYSQHAIQVAKHDVSQQAVTDGHHLVGLALEPLHDLLAAARGLLVLVL